MEITVTLSEKAVKALQAVVDRTNEQLDWDLDLEGWITLHLKEVAVNDRYVQLLQQEIAALDNYRTLVIRGAADRIRAALLDELEELTPPTEEGTVTP